MARIRPSKLKVAMDNAINTAQLSHDDETQVGSVLLKSETMAVVATGYNGFVKGAPDHELPATRPDKYQYMMHSEENLLTNCLKHGISTNDCIVVCTLSPCAHCMRLLWQAGIKKVICKSKYRDFEDILKMKDLKVSESITADGFILLEYGVKI